MRERVDKRGEYVTKWVECGIKHTQVRVVAQHRHKIKRHTHTHGVPSEQHVEDNIVSCRRATPGGNA